MRKYWFLFVVSVFLISCSSKNENDFYSLAKQYESKGENSQAISEYKNVVNNFPKSNIADSSLYKAARLEILIKNYEQALKDFKSLSENYPDSKLMPSTLFELGKLYHGKVLKKLTDKQTYTLAVDYYKKVFKRDSTFKDAPQALFMAGFLEANELNELEGAEKTYNLFIKNYPENQLVSAAKEELKTLGIPPSEILKRVNRKSAK